MYEERLRELSLFRLEKRWLRRNWLQSIQDGGDCKTLLRQVEQKVEVTVMSSSKRNYVGYKEKTSK